MTHHRRRRYEKFYSWARVKHSVESRSLTSRSVRSVWKRRKKKNSFQLKTVLKWETEEEIHCVEITSRWNEKKNFMASRKCQQNACDYIRNVITLIQLTFTHLKHILSIILLALVRLMHFSWSCHGFALWSALCKVQETRSSLNVQLLSSITSPLLSLSCVLSQTLPKQNALTQQRWNAANREEREQLLAVLLFLGWNRSSWILLYFCNLWIRYSQRQLMVGARKTATRQPRCDT